MMGDRTWVEIYIEEKDLSLLEKVIDEKIDPEGYFDNRFKKKILVINLDESNYGAYNELKELANQGILFIASSGTGGSYDPLGMVSFAGNFDTLDLNHNGEEVVRITPEGVTQADMDRAKEYFITENKVKRYWNNKSTPEELAELVSYRIKG